MLSAGYIIGITNRSRLGRAVKQIRKQGKLTQAQVAEAAGVSRLCLRDIETGNRSVGSTNVIKVLRALDHEIVIRPRRSALAEDHPSSQLRMPQ